MMNSILTSIKKMLGIEEDYTAFDTDIIININSVFMILNQLGVGPKEPFRISDKTATWNSFIGTSENIESVKTYVYLRVKMLFDPPTSSFVMDSMNKVIAELEWRLNVQSESNKKEDDNVISFDEIDEMFAQT